MSGDFSTSRPEIERDKLMLGREYGYWCRKRSLVTISSHFSVILQLRHCSDGRNLKTHGKIINTAFQYFQRPSVFRTKSTPSSKSILCVQSLQCDILIMTSRWQNCVTKHFRPARASDKQGLTIPMNKCERYVKCIVCYRLFDQINMTNINTIYHWIYKC